MYKMIKMSMTLDYIKKTKPHIIDGGCLIKVAVYLGVVIGRLFRGSHGEIIKG